MSLVLGVPLLRPSPYLVYLFSYILTVDVSNRHFRNFNTSQHPGYLFLARFPRSLVNSLSLYLCSEGPRLQSLPKHRSLLSPGPHIFTVFGFISLWYMLSSVLIFNSNNSGPWKFVVPQNCHLFRRRCFSLRISGSSFIPIEG